MPQPPGDDFLLMPHVAPLFPCAHGFIARGAEVSLHAEADDRWSVQTTDYGAPQPHGPVTFDVDFEGGQHRGEWSVAGRELLISIGGRGCAVPIRGSDDPAAAAQAIAVEMLRVHRI